MAPKATNKLDLPPLRRACGKCGRLGHLATTCANAEKAHLKVGIEIEGYWKRETFGVAKELAENWNMSGTTDGSLDNHEDHESWEFRTRPGSLGEAINQLVALYPDGTDGYCGMHVHVSFEREDMIALATKEFFEYFHEQWVLFGEKYELASGSEFWKRLNGSNSYCRRPSTGMFSTRCNVADMGRYCQVNFASYEAHKTVECRLLPMFQSARLGVLAVEWLIHIYESWLTGGLADERVWSAYGDSCNVLPPAEGPISIVSTETLKTEEDTDAAMTQESALYTTDTVAGHVRVLRSALYNRGFGALPTLNSVLGEV